MLFIIIINNTKAFNGLKMNWAHLFVALLLFLIRFRTWNGPQSSFLASFEQFSCKTFARARALFCFVRKVAGAEVI